MPNPPASRTARGRFRRWLRVLWFTAVALSWLAYAATWFVSVSRAEFSQTRAVPGLHTRFNDIHYWTVGIGSGVVYFHRPETPEPVGMGWLWRVAGNETKYRLFDLIDDDRHWQETWVAYASSDPAFVFPGNPSGAPSIKPERTTIVDRLNDPSPRITIYCPHTPSFKWRSLWVWECSLKPEVRIAFPLWPLLLLASIHPLRAAFTSTRNRRRLRKALCPTCGYSQRGLDPDAPCPECGNARQIKPHASRAQPLATPLSPPSPPQPPTAQ